MRSLTIAAGCAAAIFAAHPAGAIVYGADDRVDVAQEPDAALRRLATRSVVALIEPRQLRFEQDDSVTLRAAPLSAWDDYCPGTPFLDQATAASCGGVLIDVDLVLTAAHCLARVPSCRDYAFVFGYAKSGAEDVDSLTRDQVYGCRAVTVAYESPPDADTHVDYAIVQLDRPVGMRLAPVAVDGGAALVAGQQLTTIGFPSGLPVKLSAASVVDPRADALGAFTLTSDTFQGSSGSGLFDAAGNLVGVFARGTSDFVDQQHCSAVRVVSDLDHASGESATYASLATEALCESGWPSARWCDRSATCGDGVCSAGETSENCSADCPAPRCGDGLCEASEWHECGADCGDRRPAGLPDTWYCEPAWHADGSACDCGCGAPDPDCSGSCDTKGPAARPPRPSGPTGSGGCALSRTPAAPDIFAALLALALAGYRRLIRWRRFATIRPALAAGR